MDRTSSSGRRSTSASASSPVQSATETLIDDASASQSDIENSPPSPPALRTRGNNGSLFTRFFSESPQDAEVKLEAERIAKVLPALLQVQKELVALNSKLEKLLRLLGVATTHGTQTALSTAAATFEAAFDTFTRESAPASANARSSTGVARPVLTATLEETWNAYSTLYESTKNRSKDIEEQHRQLQRKYDSCGSPVRQTVVTVSNESDDDS